MKPLTANDLKVGGKYVPHSKRDSRPYTLHDVIEEMKKNKVEYIVYEGKDEGSHYFKASGFMNHVIFYPDELTPYHEPNQTTMNTDYTEQPFNLETALKHPEWVYFRNGEKPLVWNWFEKANIEKPIVIIDENSGVHSVTKDGLRLVNHITPYDLIIRVPCREVWINVYPDAIFQHKDQADTYADANRIACVPVKIPAI